MSWLAELAAGVAVAPDPVAARARALAGVVDALARSAGIRLPPLELLERWGPPEPVAVPPDERSPAVVPRVVEALLDRPARRRLGAYATPPAAAADLVGRALAAGPASDAVVCDPAVGGGALLLAAAEARYAAGIPRAAAVARLVGIDVDPVAAAAASAALCLWAGGAAVPEAVAGDALAPASWPVAADVVVGNPPFRSPLRGADGRPGSGPYADVATGFLVRALEEVAPGGVVALLLPASFLAARDAGPARRRALEVAEVVDVWLPAARFAGALVDVCAVVLRTDGGGAGATGASWAPRVAGVPDVAVRGCGPLGDRFEVAADFRAHYYAVAPHVVDHPAGGDDTAFPPLVTAGLVDPAECTWGRRPARHGGRRWQAPRVDLAGLAAQGHGDWARRRLVPKVVVASQTRVVEAAVDEAGAWLPSVPLVSVTGPPARLWHAAAVLLSPVTTAGALRRGAGTALAADHIKLGAPQVRALPVPVDGPDWDAAAAAVRAASSAADPAARRRALLAAAAASCAAYGVPADGLVDWWADRLPAT